MRMMVACTERSSGCDVGDPSRSSRIFCAVIRGVEETRVSTADAARTRWVTLAVAEPARQGGVPMRVD